MTKIFVLVLASAFVSAVSLGQDYTFKVLVNKGKNEVKTGNAWAPLKTGTTLNSSDELKLVDNSYIGLVHASGRPLEVKLPGNYKVADLSAKVGKGASVLNKYTDFILSSSNQKSNRLSATGAVHRGGNDTKIYLPKPEHAIVYGDSVILSWQLEEARDEVYVLSLKNMFGDELLYTETTDTTAAISIVGKGFDGEENVMVQIYPKSKPEKKQDPAYMVKKLSDEERNKIAALLDEMSGQTSEANALNKLILAGFFEENKLLVDAATAYLQAIRLAPDVNQYREAYQNFLLRNGMREQKIN